MKRRAVFHYMLVTAPNKAMNMLKINIYVALTKSKYFTDFRIIFPLQSIYTYSPFSLKHLYGCCNAVFNRIALTSTVSLKKKKKNNMMYMLKCDLNSTNNSSLITHRYIQHFWYYYLHILYIMWLIIYVLLCAVWARDVYVSYIRPFNAYLVFNGLGTVFQITNWYNFFFKKLGKHNKFMHFESYYCQH